MANNQSMDKSDTFEQAEQLLRELPLRPDIFERLDGLRQQTPEQYRFLFDNFYEAAIAAS
ncbi:MAG: hypothetical protein OQK99_01030 [Gammaproteobacteria bacterium]|nr:hypothetical protein [Gammaproteobacteria bacterium]